MSAENQACVYAALMLHAAGVAPTADNIEKSVTASGMTVRPTLPLLFARFVEKKGIDSLIAAAASSSAAPAAGAAPAAAAGGAAPAAEKKKEAEPEEEEDDFGPKEMSAENQACVYAALMLHAAGVAPTADNIEKSVTASGMTVRPTLPLLFARFVEKKGIDSLIAAAASSSAAPAAGAAPAAAAGGAAPAAEKKKEAEPEEEEDDFGMGGLF